MKLSFFSLLLFIVIVLHLHSSTQKLGLTAVNEGMSSFRCFNLKEQR